jgi:hypothetical protein
VHDTPALLQLSGNVVANVAVLVKRNDGSIVGGDMSHVLEF